MSVGEMDNRPLMRGWRTVLIAAVAVGSCVAIAHLWVVAGVLLAYFSGLILGELGVLDKVRETQERKR